MLKRRDGVRLCFRAARSPRRSSPRLDPVVVLDGQRGELRLGQSSDRGHVEGVGRGIGVSSSIERPTSRFPVKQHRHRVQVVRQRPPAVGRVPAAVRRDAHPRRPAQHRCARGSPEAAPRRRSRTRSRRAGWRHRPRVRPPRSSGPRDDRGRRRTMRRQSASRACLTVSALVKPSIWRSSSARRPSRARSAPGSKAGPRRARPLRPRGRARSPRRCRRWLPAIGWRVSAGRVPARLATLQLGSEHLGEQLVEPIPVVLPVERGR